MCIKNVSTAVRAAISAVLLAGAALPAIVLANPADDPAVVGREGQAFGKTLSDTFQFPTEGAGGTLNLGNGESINPNDMAPGGEGLYIQAPNVGGLQGIFDSDESMHDVGRGAQNQLWQDAQAKGNPFDPDPAMRDQPGPSTVSGAVYQIITGVSGARAQVPDLANDPIVNGADAHMLNPDMLESFGDCSIQSEVIETSRPVHVPDIEFCERVTAPAPSNCEIKHEIVLERVNTVQQVSLTGNLSVPRTRCRDGIGFGTSAGGNIPRNFNVEVGGTDACSKGGEADLSGLAVSYTADGAEAINWVDNGLQCGRNFSSGSVRGLSLSKPVCSNGKLIVPGTWAEGSVNSENWKLDGVRIHALTVRIKGPVSSERITVETDNWYPQECIDIANSSSG